ncbi:MAG: hypothetical protein KJ600_06845 [Nanoarchaeota archaeon]|nr:hypothetical protein [Nanoarchaeota archaeon]
MSAEEETEESKSLRILNPSPNLLVNAIKTFPEKILTGGLSFLANGIPLSRSREDAGTYLSACKAHGVMPYTQMKLSHEGRRDSFRAELPRELFLTAHPKELDIAVEGLIPGGRIYRLEIDFGFAWGADSGFVKFKEHLLEQLCKEGYVPDMGELWVTHDSTRGYDEGDSMADGLLIRPGELGAPAVPYVELRTGQKTTPEQDQTLKDWFKGIES